ncbi:hypothetical protein A3A20_02955 [Candidatus Wolfebacteria bacterium RIFCSPLOWO2_01_FULL_45_19]|uniref:Band 7 domain-containing protein n=1 Tax=Candidatus Wolfebacteria bacterium RIFCSPLOWO2_01_FULL_45_19 TaxID=1802557 RepID=A0A1F8DQ60_9BACT|nr:MAG: hypothetical protein UX23_C0008G0042 [Parcubacteria group bacterium GW2011_GWB1_45_9]OGM90754.1 MAG: hypothetical protein A3A20_02955 [Candidatus Wolfebacteria bacterium RIFCSPLOWO2_01_FULL_45_19]
MEFLLIVIFLLLLAYFLFGWDKVSPLHYALVFLFGRHGPQHENSPRWGWTAKEGWIWVPPLFGKKIEYPARFKEFNAQITIQTKEAGDNKKKDRPSLAVTFTLSGTRRPDYNFLNRYRKWDDALENDLKARLQEKLQGIAGQYTTIELITQHSDVGRFINALARLSEEAMPHLHGTNYGESQNIIPDAKILNFYKKHSAAINKLLDGEFNNPEPSYIENYYGCDFGKINLSPPELSQEAKRAFAARTEAAQKIKAVREKSGMVKDLMDEHSKRGLNIQWAFNEVDHALGASKEIISIEEREGAHGKSRLWITPRNKYEPKKGD